MFDIPRRSDWIVPAVFMIFLASVLTAILPVFPDPESWTGWIRGLVLFLGGLLLLCFVVCLAGFARWGVYTQTQNFLQRQEAKAITPLQRAAVALRELTPEQAQLIPRFMPNDSQAVYVDEGDELSDPHFYTAEGLIPWDFIEKFLWESNAVSLMPISSTNDKTPERVFCQAMTNVMIRKGWAVPAVGPHAAQWKTMGRERAAKFFHVQLRNGERNENSD